MRVSHFLPALALVALACEEEPTQGPTVDFVAEGTTFTPASASTSATKKIMLWGFADGPHNVTFEDGATGSGDRSSGVFQRDYTTVAAGTHRFRCTIHSTDFATGMVGQVVVP
jgi:plastocyanin